MALMAVARDDKARYDLGALEQRVFGLEKAIGDISAAISALGAKIDERARTPWATLISALVFLLMFISTVGVLVYNPINSELTRHERLIAKVQDRYIADLQKRIEHLRRVP